MTEIIPESVSKTLAHPVCVKCGAPWHWVDGMLDTVFCSSEEHGTLWYYPNSGAIDWEVRTGDSQYDVRWSCSCMREQCSGRNVIFEVVDYDNPREAGIWYFDAPFSMTIEDVAVIVARTPDERE